jgi:hypothetical protein
MGDLRVQNVRVIGKLQREAAPAAGRAVREENLRGRGAAEKNDLLVEGVEKNACAA